MPIYVIIVIVIIGLLVRYFLTGRSGSGKSGYKGRGPVYWAFICIVLLFVGGMLFYDLTMEPSIKLDGDSFKVGGLFKTEWRLGEVTDITLKDEAPVVLNKDFGSQISDVCRGTFTIDKLGKGKLYIHLNSTPFIYMHKGNEYMVLNYKDSKKTRDLYERLIKEWKE